MVTKLFSVCLCIYIYIYIYISLAIFSVNITTVRVAISVDFCSRPNSLKFKMYPAQFELISVEGSIIVSFDKATVHIW